MSSLRSAKSTDIERKSQNLNKFLSSIFTQKSQLRNWEQNQGLLYSKRPEIGSNIPDFFSGRAEGSSTKPDVLILKQEATPQRQEFRTQKIDGFSLKRSKDPLNDSLQNLFKKKSEELRNSKEKINSKLDTKLKTLVSELETKK